MKPIRHTVSRSVGKWAELTVSLSVDRVGKRAELVSKLGSELRCVGISLIDFIGYHVP